MCADAPSPRTLAEFTRPSPAAAPARRGLGGLAGRRAIASAADDDLPPSCTAQVFEAICIKRHRFSLKSYASGRALPSCSRSWPTRKTSHPTRSHHVCDCHRARRENCCTDVTKAFAVDGVRPAVAPTCGDSTSLAEVCHETVCVTTGFRSLRARFSSATVLSCGLQAPHGPPEDPMALSRLSLTTPVRRLIATAVADSTEPGAVSIRGDLGGPVLEVPVPRTVTISGSPVLAPATPGDRFSVLVQALAMTDHPMAWRIIEGLVADSEESAGWSVPPLTQSGAGLSLGVWNVFGGTLDVPKTSDRDLVALRCRGVTDLVGAAEVVALTELETGGSRRASRVALNRAGWAALVSAAGAVLLRSAPGLPATRPTHQVGVAVRADRCTEITVVAGGLIAGGGEWQAIRVADMLLCNMYAPSGDPGAIGAAIDEAERHAADVPMVVCGDLNLRGLPEGAKPGKYQPISALHAISAYRAIMPITDSGCPGWVPTWRVDHRTGQETAGGRFGSPIQLDHVLARPDQISEVALSVLDHRGSDHRALLAQIGLAGAAPSRRVDISGAQ